MYPFLGTLTKNGIVAEWEFYFIGENVQVWRIVTSRELQITQSPLLMVSSKVHNTKIIYHLNSYKQHIAFFKTDITASELHITEFKKKLYCVYRYECTGCSSIVLQWNTPNALQKVQYTTLYAVNIALYAESWRWYFGWTLITTDFSTYFCLYRRRSVTMLYVSPRKISLL